MIEQTIIKGEGVTLSILQQKNSYAETRNCYFETFLAVWKMLVIQISYIIKY